VVYAQKGRIRGSCDDIEIDGRPAPPNHHGDDHQEEGTMSGKGWWLVSWTAVSGLAGGTTVQSLDQ